MPKELITFTKFGREVSLVVDDEVIAAEIREYMDFSEHWMLDFIHKYIKRGGTWIDCGANFGNHSVFFAMFCPCYDVVAFEPVATNARLCDANASLNGLFDILTIDAAVGAKVGKCKMNKASNARNSQYVATLDKGETEILTIDSLYDGNEVGLIKIDVEGMEVDVINGALLTIDIYKPEIFVEVWEAEKLQAINEILAPFGYHQEGCYNPAPTYHFSTQTYPTMY